ncbi:MAG: DNA polymerase III subunit chi [Candidatus Aquirickettsiella sp.]
MPNPTVDFYLLNTLLQEDIYRFTCRLVDKAYLLQKRVYIHVNSHEEGKRLDDLLWTFRDISFIPHSYLVANSILDPMLWVNIATDKPNALEADILFNLSDEVPTYFSEFARIIEVVSEEKKNKSQSRQKYKFYKTQNCPLTMHNISAS